MIYTFIEDGEKKCMRVGLSPFAKRMIVLGHKVEEDKEALANKLVEKIKAFKRTGKARLDRKMIAYAMPKRGSHRG